MKKIIVLALAIVGAAACSQAASVKWDSAKLYTAAGAEGGFSSTAIKSAATGYLFLISESEYDTLLAGYNASGDMSLVYKNYKDSLASADATGSSKVMTSAVSITTDHAVGDTVYGAIIYTYTDATFGDFYIANIGTGTIGAESGLTIGNLGIMFADPVSGTATGGWVPVPEPTSGLLALLGFAGLALRRRRA